MPNTLTRLAALIACAALASCGKQQGMTSQDFGPDADADGHTAATQFTASHNTAVGAELSLADPAEFDDAKRGFIATDDPLVVKNDAGAVIWDRPGYDFIKGDAPPSVNPSLWRQAQLNNFNGLFKVTDRIFQVRGYDISNMSVIEGDTGRILVDPLTTVFTSTKALALVNRTLGERPLVAIILTHSHIDHFGGIKGVVSAADVRSGKVRVVAPLRFTEEAVSENVIAGVVMGRRAQYMYGLPLDRSERGHVDTGLGKGPAVGNISILAPTDSVDHTGQTMRIDGVDFVFQYVPHSEAPAELTFHLPQFKAFCGAEIVSQNMHNLYTLRGAKVRDALLWSGYIDEAIDRFGADTAVVFNSHHWPVWGEARVIEYLKQQRDTYRYLHDQTLRLASQGLTPSEIADALVLPESLRRSFPSRGYYGTAKHNARAVYQFYFGWYDGNPANLDSLPPEEEGKRYVDAIGGVAAVVAKAQAAYDQGDYRWAATLLKHVVFADPDNDTAKGLLARTYDQLGYQAESGPWRDEYLTGAQELRHGVKPVGPITVAADILNNIPLDQFFTAMATRLNGPKADGKQMTINFVFKDEDKTIVVRVENAVLHHKDAPADPNADATVTVTRAFWLKLITKQVSIKDLVFSDEYQVQGSRTTLLSFFSLLDDPNPNFAIVTP
ncbi:MAG TPA: alkyl sulfatase dimerization domain-containing protein [Candidatus Binatia bacterium]|nr:alkyl sulfatase dimerization domain-containing protein [Candidatus Binatia bacterium]